MGGPNSVDAFAKSWQRAAGFREITPVRRNSMSLSQGEGDEEAEAAGIRSNGPSPQAKSLLRQQFEAAGGHGLNESAVQDPNGEQSEPTETTKLLQPTAKPSIQGSLRASIAASSFGQSYGSISSRLTATAQRRASILIEQQREASMRALEDDDSEYKEDLIHHHVEEEVLPDGEVIQRICGESTVPQTIFNSVNVLIGVGILALPLGIRLSGWVLGLIFLLLAALSTNYTAKLLARCLDTNSGATTYGDIAFLAFGSFGRNMVESLFILELTAANVALIILFGDTMNSLIPSVPTLTWKALLALGLIPLNFAPFKYLSVTSILGIMCCLGIVLIVLIDGFLKPHSPGSLREVATTYAFPQDWRTVPLSLGLFMAPWGGHSVFPAIYKDMRHPQKYTRALNYTYVFTYGLDLAMAVLGYLMFGDGVRDELTTNLLKSSHYPHALNVLTVVLIAIIPVTKVPLTNRPMSDTINKKFLIDLRQMDPKARRHSEKSWKHNLARGVISCSANVIQLGIAVLVPNFDSIMGLMGSALCFTICVIMPVAFYLKIFAGDGSQIGKLERAVDWMLIIVCTALGILGTVFSILPRDKVGLSS
jgi:solute carrier family 32 (vesicular inhibitory amino acid transporter)